MEVFIKPKIYIDTNIIVDIVQGIHTPSIDLIEEIKNNGWDCITSQFALMEALSVQKDNEFIYEKIKEGWTFKKILRKRDDKDLSDKTLELIYTKIKNRFFTPYKFVQFYWLDEVAIEKAIKICKESNLSASDSIHLATALEVGCDLLVSTDSIFCKNAEKYLPCCSPENVNEKIKEIKIFSL